MILLIYLQNEHIASSLIALNLQKNNRSLVISFALLISIWKFRWLIELKPANYHRCQQMNYFASFFLLRLSFQLYLCALTNNGVFWFFGNIRNRNEIIFHGWHFSVFGALLNSGFVGQCHLVIVRNIRILFVCWLELTFWDVIHFIDLLKEYNEKLTQWICIERFVIGLLTQ